MSDDFDKEAEREKLRKKYEKDKQEREATEQMSELLLQGATMTNSHCSECGDPIFRYDGQEFCPTCEKPVDSQPENGERADDETDQESIQVRSPSNEARVKFGSAEEDDQPEQANTQQTEQSQHQQTPDEHQQTPGQQAGPAEPQRTPGRQQTPEPQGTPEPQQTPETPTSRGQLQEGPVASPGDGGLADAEQSLVRTLARFSKQAEATEDPRKAKEQLEAAREAAEALAALRR